MPTTSNACSRRAWSCSRPATTSAPSTPTRPALTHRPDRADALSNLGAAYVQLGQFDDAIAAVPGGADRSIRQQHSGPDEPRRWPITSRRVPTRRSPQLKRVVASRPDAEERATCCSADCYLQTGQDQDVVALLQPREALFGDDLAYAYHARHGAAADRRRPRRTAYIDRIFGAGDSAEAHLLHGDRPPEQAGLSAGEERARTGDEAQPAAADAAFALRPRAAGRR